PHRVLSSFPTRRSSDLHGMIDFSRLLQTLRTDRGELALDRKGLPALEGMLVARGLMYSSVYFHKTVRIAEEMLARAVERSEAPRSEEHTSELQSRGHLV